MMLAYPRQVRRVGEESSASLQRGGEGVAKEVGRAHSGFAGH